MLLTKYELVDAIEQACVVSVPLVESPDLFSDSPFVLELLNSVPNLYAILNSDHQIVFVNQALLEWLKLESLESIVGWRAGDVFQCVNARKQPEKCTMNEQCRTCGVLRALQSCTYRKQTIQECRIAKEDGEALDLRVWASRLSLPDGLYTLLAINDISHEKRRYALERVFFHDILNTASSVQGFAKLLLDVSTGDHEDMAEIISDMARQLVDEIQAQQLLSSAESGQLSFHMATVDSLAVLQETVALYRIHEAALDRSIQVTPESESVDFDSDPALIKRVLGNMTLNALEATAPGECVTVSCHAIDSDQVEFRVHNSQVMPQEVQLQIFQRSFSTKGNGRGLGTYSMKLLTDRYLQGQIHFESSQESGTYFIARYPRRMLPTWMMAQSS